MHQKAFLLAAALLAGCASTPRTGLQVVQRVEHLDVVAREPMFVEHPGGTLFVSGYWEPRPTLWKSVDRGTTWSRVDVGTEAEGAVGNSDVDLAMAPDGTLYFAAMTYDREAGEGRQIAVGVSSDAGSTWRWTTLSKVRFDDRPWVEVTPDGTAHAIWNDGVGVSYTASRDRGKTWTPATRIHDRGGSSHLAAGPAGELAVRITPLSASGNKYDEGVDLIAVSTDGGGSWQKYPAPGQRDWSPDFMSDATPRWVEPLAWDSGGRLYSLWADKQGIRLARSDDRGAHWRTWTVTETAAPAFFPYLAARGEGELAATWFTASTNDMHDLRWQVARIGGAAGEAEPRVRISAPQSLESRRPREKDGPLFNDPAGEYLPVGFLRDGSIAVVTPVQNQPAGRRGFVWWTFQNR
ncbi:MAG TPA: sialidase family protein [Thermoanaerobaculia bacterium]|jgi:hypothetical protein